MRTMCVVVAGLFLLVSGVGCRIDVCNEPSSKFRLVLTAPSGTAPEDGRLVVDVVVEIPGKTTWRRHGVYRLDGRLSREGVARFVFDPGLRSSLAGDARTATVRLDLAVLDADGRPVLVGSHSGEVRTDRCEPDVEVSLSAPDCVRLDDGALCSVGDGGGVCRSGQCVASTCGEVPGIQPFSGEVCDGGWACEECALHPVLLDLGATGDGGTPDYVRTVKLEGTGACSADARAELYPVDEFYFHPPGAFREVPVLSLVLADLVGESLIKSSTSPDSQMLMGVPGYGETGLVAASGFGFLSGRDVTFDPQESAFLAGMGGGGAFGLRIAVGDVDGDGYRDVVVGAPVADGDRVHVFLSSSSFDEGSSWSTEAGRTATIGGTEAFFGYGLAVADLNGDGVAEVIVGSPAADGFRGAVTIYAGGSFVAGTGEVGGTGSALRTFVGPAVNRSFGAAVAVGDFDGDMAPDLAVGQPLPEAGSDPQVLPVVFVLFSPMGPEPEVRCTASGCGSSSLLLAAPDLDSTPFPRFGALLAAGDLDQDGYDELVVASPSDDASSPGRVYVYAGSDLAESAKEGRPAWPRLALEAPPGSAFGAGLLVADVNHDRVPDLVVSAPLRDGGGRTAAGAVYVVLGSVKWPWPAHLEVYSTEDLESQAVGRNGTPAGDFHGLSAIVIHGPAENARLGIGLAAGPVTFPGAKSPSALLGLGHVGRDETCGVTFVDLCQALEACGGGG